MTSHLHYRFLLTLLVVWLSSFNSVLAKFKLKGDGRCNKFLCVNATVHDSTVIYQMTPLKYPVGYLGLGFGQRMAFSHMVVLWENDDGTTTLSQRYTESHAMPQFIAQPPRKAWLPDVKPADWHPHANSSMTFEVQRTHGQLQSISEDPLLTTFVWAFSYFRPDSASPETDIRQHYIAGSLRLDLNKELDPVVATSPLATG
ncbi:hypothetical protein PQX77_001087, partial [Marasmius sp. AFHP31]